jgi:hypothetical protein
MMATLSRVLFGAMLTLALVACNRQPAQNQTPTEAPHRRSRALPPPLLKLPTSRRRSRR